jgi:hypothetical protein
MTPDWIRDKGVLTELLQADWCFGAEPSRRFVTQSETDRRVDVYQATVLVAGNMPAKKVRIETARQKITHAIRIAVATHLAAVTNACRDRSGSL